MKLQSHSEQELFETHPVLHHYTDLAGLRGIISSQCLWATHYKALNDFSEVIHMRPRLEKIAYALINEIMRREAKASFQYRRFLEQHGGLHKCSCEEAANVINILYQITFEGRQREGGFAEPYVVSFCAHSKHSEYIKRNGLLSQWRAYGNEGGYALVFDTKALWSAFAQEREGHYYAGFNIADVIYGDVGDGEIEKELPDLIGTLRAFLVARSRGEQDAPAGQLFEPFFNIVTRFKHEAFKEESEVRLCVAPFNQRVLDAARKFDTSKPIPNRGVKSVLGRLKRGVETPYIVLNAEKKRLPIKQILVGPQVEQRAMVEHVARLVAGKIPVLMSDTPYRPI